MNAIVLVHCGLGTAETPEARSILETLLTTAAQKVSQGDSALSVTWFVVNRLEESGLFNAGRGAIAQEDGVVRRDIGTMNGSDLRPMGLLSLSGTPCPTDLLTRLYGHTRHVLVSGMMAESFGIRHHLSSSQALQLPSETAIDLWDEKAGIPAPGTVGAVVRDLSGHVAATTSTGGMGQMLPGRIGDSPIPGAGYYADDEIGAISMTGHGEGILSMALGIRLLLAHQAAPDPQTARIHCQDLLDRLEAKTGYQAGAILTTRQNGPLILHLGERMLAGSVRPGAHPFIQESFHRTEI